MKSLFSLFFVGLCSLLSFAQSSKLTIKPRQLADFITALSSSTLIVTIYYDDNPEELEMIEAVKKYWTATPIKFITIDEFKKEHADKWYKQKQYLYLVRETYNVQSGKIDSRYAKYFISRATSGVQLSSIPYLEFKVPSKISGKMQEPYNYVFIYDLMMKHFAYEVQYLKDTKNYHKVSKGMLLSSSFSKDLKEYANRDILVSPKDLENYLMKVPIERRTKHEELDFRKFIARKTKTNVEKIKMMTDYDIEAVVDTNNTKVLIYTGYSIYRPEDGKMLRRVDPNRARNSAKQITFGVCSIGLLMIIIAAASSY